MQKRSTSFSFIGKNLTPSGVGQGASAKTSTLFLAQPGRIEDVMNREFPYKVKGPFPKGPVGRICKTVGRE